MGCHLLWRIATSHLVQMPASLLQLQEKEHLMQQPQAQQLNP